MGLLQSSPLITTLLLLFFFIAHQSSAQSTLCRAFCGPIAIRYPFGVDDGCGSPLYRNLLTCTASSLLRLRTPSGSYPVLSISYSPNPHLVVADPTTWRCRAGPAAPGPPFALDASTRLSLSAKNNFLFFNCSPDSVLSVPEPEPALSGTRPHLCDSAAYLCRNLPGCPEGDPSSCCSYYPTASESLRLMTGHCGAYASVYWREAPPYDRTAEYGIRVDFEIPVTARCLRCQDRGKGVCGFGNGSGWFNNGPGRFVCLCEGGNSTSECGGDGGGPSRSKASAGVVAGTTVVGIAGFAGAGALALYLRKMRTSKVVACGVETNENRLF